MVTDKDSLIEWDAAFDDEEQVVAAMMEMLVESFTADCEERGAEESARDHFTRVFAGLTGDDAALGRVEVEDADDGAGWVPAAQATLAAVVHGPRRGHHVQSILQLDSAHQQALMLVIERVQQQVGEEGMSSLGDAGLQDSQASAGSEVDECHIEEELASGDEEPDAEGPEAGAGAATAASSAEVARLRDLLSKAEEQAEVRVEEASRPLRQRAAELQNRVAELEREAEEAADAEAREQQRRMESETRRENKWREERMRLEDTIESLRKREEKLGAESKRAHEAETRCRQLQDELDVARSAAARANKLEATVARQSAMIDDARAVRERMARLEEKYENRVSRVAALEQEVSAMNSLRARVSEYKAKLSERDVRLAEMGQELAALRDATARGERDQGLSRSVEEGSRSEREALEALVSAEAEAAREVGGNVAEGLSDLNPETRERMAALAAENEQLRQAVDAQTADRVQRLEDELEDACAGKKTFEERFLATKGEKEALETSLSAAHDAIAGLEAEARARTAELEDLQSSLDASSQCAADRAATIAALQSELAQEKERLAMALADVESRAALHRDAVTRLTAAAEMAAEDSRSRMVWTVESVRADAARRVAEAESHCEDEVARKDEEVRRWQQSHAVSNEQHEARVAELEGNLRKFKRMARESLEMARDKVSNAERELARHKSKIAKGRAMLAKKTEEAKRHASARVRAEDDAFAAMQRAASAEEARRQAELAGASLREEAERAQDEVDACQLQIAELTDQATKATKELEALRKGNPGLVGAGGSGAGGQGGAVDSVSEEGFVDAVRAQQAAIDRLETEKRTLRASLDEERKKRQKLANRCRSLEQACEDLRASEVSAKLRAQREAVLGGASPTESPRPAAKGAKALPPAAEAATARPRAQDRVLRSHDANKGAGARAGSAGPRKTATRVRSARAKEAGAAEKEPECAQQ